MDLRWIELHTIHRKREAQSIHKKKQPYHKQQQQQQTILTKLLVSSLDLIQIAKQVHCKLQDTPANIMQIQYECVLHLASTLVTLQLLGYISCTCAYLISSGSPQKQLISSGLAHNYLISL